MMKKNTLKDTRRGTDAWLEYVQDLFVYSYITRILMFDGIEIKNSLIPRTRIRENSPERR